ncbi:MAG: hypothetical protein E7635_05435 [Ruminococcaceae bacterium]|nr:hypothetical protein [Oscillospiraceae bacterium]
MKEPMKKISAPAKIAIAIAVVFCVVRIVSYQIEYSSLRAQQADIQEKIEYYTERVDELENKLEAPFDDEYIIKVAKEKLNYCLPEEIIFYNDLEQ